MEERFFSFNNYLQGIFGERVHRISIDAGFNCPNLDGTKSRQGCTYCNNKGFTIYSRSIKSIEEQIEDSIRFYRRRLGVTKFIAYFQAFTNTYADVDVLRETYDVIKKFSQVVGLFISTRPDFVDRKILELISQYKKDYLVWIEYGLQTTHNRLLKIINRNHTYEDFLQALKITREHEINVGVHLILGLPTQTYQEMIADAQIIAGLDIQGIKFHILHILKGTKLESLWQQGKITLLGEKEYVGIICDFLERVPSNFVILRLISSAFSDYLVAPLWINKRAKVIEAIKEELERRQTHQGYLLDYKQSLEIFNF